MRYSFGLHKHFRLIFLWALGYPTQERYEWYKDWVDCHGTPLWSDPEAQFRLKPDCQIQIKLHPRFSLILLWSMGLGIQEKYYWYRDWSDSHGTPDWSDLDAKFRLKLLRRSKIK
jgi:hypothetical protein